MKKFIVLIAVFLIAASNMFALASSDLIISEEDNAYEIVPDRKDLPGNKEVNKLYEGMPLADALDIMGNPQGTYSGIGCLIYNLRNGQSLKLYFNADENNTEFVWDIKIMGWPYRLIIAIALTVVLISAIAVIIIKVRKNIAQKGIK